MGDRAIIQCAVFAGSPEEVAPILSLTYLFFTSVLNGAIVLLKLIGAPNFRPRWCPIHPCCTRVRAARVRAQPPDPDPLP